MRPTLWKAEQFVYWPPSSAHHLLVQQAKLDDGFWKALDGIASPWVAVNYGDHGGYRPRKQRRDQEDSTDSPIVVSSRAVPCPVWRSPNYGSVRRASEWREHPAFSAE